MENKKLQKINQQLEKENNTLKLLLKRHGISTTAPSSSSLTFVDNTPIDDDDDDTQPSEILS